MCCGTLPFWQKTEAIVRASVDVSVVGGRESQWRRKAKGDAQRAFEMVVQGGLSLSVVQTPRVSANITVRDLDVGATVPTHARDHRKVTGDRNIGRPVVWRLGNVSGRAMLRAKIPEHI